MKKKSTMMLKQVTEREENFATFYLKDTIHNPDLECVGHSE